MKKTLILVTCLLSLNACSTNATKSTGVKSWERSFLAKPDMALNDDPVTNAFNEHIYFSKEASSGGRSFGGGGCGCN